LQTVRDYVAGIDKLFQLTLVSGFRLAANSLLTI